MDAVPFAVGLDCGLDGCSAPATVQIRVDLTSHWLRLRACAWHEGEMWRELEADTGWTVPRTATGHLLPLPWPDPWKQRGYPHGQLVAMRRPGGEG